jgi:hypothetical protein
VIAPLEYPLPEIMKDRRHPDESAAGVLIRKLHRRFFAAGVFRVSRLMPEISIFSFAVKRQALQSTNA